MKEALDCMQFLLDSACMGQVTIRKVEKSWVAKAKAEARMQGVSMNTVLRESLRRGLGVDGETPLNGLEKYAGDSDFGPEWDDFLEELNQVDPEDWK